MKLELIPLDLDEAFQFIRLYHRHHEPPQGGKFAVGVAEWVFTDKGEGWHIVGVAVVGRVIARMAEDGWTAEVTRVCVKEGYPNACSMLYGTCWRAARAMGYRKLRTAILKSEPGTSLKAAGWRIIGETQGGTWSRQFRPRVDKHPLEQKLIWEISGEVAAS